MKDTKEVMKELLLELAKYAGATVVVGFCMWLIVCGVILLTHTPRKTTKKQRATNNWPESIFGQEKQQTQPG
jgi:hypothetical protein